MGAYAPLPKKEGQRMRKVMVMVALVALFTLVAAGVAVAVTRTCTSVPCKGTSADDVLRERVGDGKRDVIYGLRGDDRLDAGSSLRSGPAETDVLYGGRGNDRVFAVDEDFRDKAYGGPGKHDRCLVDAFREGTPTCEDVIVVIY